MSDTKVAERVERISGRFHALGHATRLHIYHHLIRCGEAGCPVNDLQKELQIPGSTLSHHLKVLESVDLVLRQRLGTTHQFRAHYPVMEDMIGFLQEECCSRAATPADMKLFATNEETGEGHVA